MKPIAEWIRPTKRFMMGCAALLLSTYFVMAADAILTVDGATSKGTTTFTLSDLDALPQIEIKTATPWYDGPQTFKGPRLAEVLAVAGGQGSNITAHALNDYSAELPVSDAADFGVILATRINGEELSIRDKGPIFIIYPYDSDEKLRHDIYYGRSVWQVDKLTLK